MATAYFQRYDLENPQTLEVRTIDKRTYVLAGLFGAFYVLCSGFVARFFLAMFLDLAIVASAVCAGLIAASYLGPGEFIIGLAVIVAGVPVIRSVPLVRLIKEGYRRRGWDLMRH